MAGRERANREQTGREQTGGEQTGREQTGGERAHQERAHRERAGRQWTRRQAIGRGGALIAGLGAAPGLLRPRAGATAANTATTANSATAANANTAADATTADTVAGPLWSFVSRPDLQAPAVTVTAGTDGQSTPEEAGYIFTTPNSAPPNSTRPAGRMITDWNGQVIWYSPAGAYGTSNLAVQTYQDCPVLTWFDNVPTMATIANSAFSPGIHTIADKTYTPIATVTAVGDGYASDMHDCTLTPQGTACITVGRLASADLTAVGGPADGQILDYCVQEIDVATGNLLFQWSGVENIPITDSYAPYTTDKLYDPYHFNSIGVAPDGTLLISARNTWTVYKVSRQTGALVWRLGGKRSSFAMGAGAGFAWQHHARAYKDGMVSIFDDEAPPTPSRAILLSLNTNTMQASLFRQFTRPDGLSAGIEGSVQGLDENQVLVGYGQQPYTTLFAADGTVLWDAEFPTFGGGPRTGSYQSYRALNFKWTGIPAEPPAAAAVSDGNGGAVVYASWNGATEVAQWTVLAGPQASSLAKAGTVACAGFETPVPVADAGPYYVTVAKSASGKELARSAPVALPAS